MIFGNAIKIKGVLTDDELYNCFHRTMRKLFITMGRYNITPARNTDNVYVFAKIVYCLGSLLKATIQHDTRPGSLRSSLFGSDSSLNGL